MKRKNILKIAVGELDVMNAKANTLLFTLLGFGMKILGGCLGRFSGGIRGFVVPFAGRGGRTSSSSSAGRLTPTPLMRGT